MDRGVRAQPLYPEGPAAVVLKTKTLKKEDYGSRYGSDWSGTSVR